MSVADWLWGIGGRGVGRNHGLGYDWGGNDSLVNCWRLLNNGIESVVMVSSVVNSSDALRKNYFI